MFSMRVNAHLDVSHHWRSHPFKDAGVAADSLTGIHSAMVKSFFVANVARMWYAHWWDVSRRALDLTEDILTTYYKRILSAVVHKLNVSGHMLIWTFSLFWYVELVPKIWQHFSVTFYIYMFVSLYLPVYLSLNSWSRFTYPLHGRKSRVRTSHR
jgi:hypothetical protein